MYLNQSHALVMFDGESKMSHKTTENVVCCIIFTSRTEFKNLILLLSSSADKLCKQFWHPDQADRKLVLIWTEFV